MDPASVCDDSADLSVLDDKLQAPRGSRQHSQTGRFEEHLIKRFFSKMRSGPTKGRRKLDQQQQFMPLLGLMRQGDARKCSECKGPPDRNRGSAEGCSQTARTLQGKGCRGISALNSLSSLPLGCCWGSPLLTAE